MSLIRWNPVRDLTTFPSGVLNMQREMNKMFDSFFRGSTGDEFMNLSAWTPAADIAEHDDAFVVKAELPGLTKEDVKITVRDNVLTIQGEKKQESESKESNYRSIERTYGSFQRSFTLPTSIKSDKIDASFKDGVLSITMPKAEDARPKQIEVKVK